MALIGVSKGDVDVCWTDQPGIPPFCITLGGNADFEFMLSREAFDDLVIAINRLQELDQTRNMKIRERNDSSWPK